MKLSIAGTDEGLRRAADAFEAFGARHDVPPEVRWRFLVALDEALSNIARHGYGGAAGPIDLTFSLDNGVLRIGVSDGGPAFNPLTAGVADISSPLESRQPGGVGIALVCALMDHVTYERRDERNHLALSRRLDDGRRRASTE